MWCGDGLEYFVGDEPLSPRYYEVVVFGAWYGKTHVRSFDVEYWFEDKSLHLRLPGVGKYNGATTVVYERCLSASWIF